MYGYLYNLLVLPAIRFGELKMDYRSPASKNFGPDLPGWDLHWWALAGEDLKVRVESSSNPIWFVCNFAGLRNQTSSSDLELIRKTEISYREISYKNFYDSKKVFQRWFTISSIIVMFQSSKRNRGSINSHTTVASWRGRDHRGGDDVCVPSLFVGFSHLWFVVI